MLISKSKKFIFLHIPKTAGTSIRFVLGQYADLDTGFAHLPKDIKNLDLYDDYNKLEEYTRTVRARSVGTYPVTLGSGFHMNQTYLKKSNLWQEDLSNYFEFAIVREPLIRLVSIYNYLTEQQRLRMGNFSRFIRLMKNNYTGDVINDRFFRPQSDWLTDPLSDKVHVFKFETITVDPDVLNRALDINLSWPHLNANKNKKLLTVEDIPANDYNFCLDFLEHEYELLGYSKPERK